MCHRSLLSAVAARLSSPLPSALPSTSQAQDQHQQSNQCMFVPPVSMIESNIEILVPTTTVSKCAASSIMALRFRDTCKVIRLALVR
jgi:hypothetical protein